MRLSQKDGISSWMRQLQQREKHGRNSQRLRERVRRDIEL